MKLLSELFKRSEPPKPTYKVCEECKVHYEPVPTYALGEKEHAHLCPKCRAPQLELFRRKDVVMRWAGKNWEKLEKRATKAAAAEAKQAVVAAGLAAEYNKQCASQHGGVTSLIGGNPYNYYPGRNPYAGSYP